MPLVGASGTVWGAALVPKEEEGGKRVGVVTNPIFVSVGHRVSLETCVALTKAVGRCACSYFRLSISQSTDDVFGQPPTAAKGKCYPMVVADQWRQRCVSKSRFVGRTG